MFILHFWSSYHQTWNDDNPRQNILKALKIWMMTSLPRLYDVKKLAVLLEVCAIYILLFTRAKNISSNKGLLHCLYFQPIRLQLRRYLWNRKLGRMCVDSIQALTSPQLALKLTPVRLETYRQ